MIMGNATVFSVPLRSEAVFFRTLATDHRKKQAARPKKATPLIWFFRSSQAGSSRRHPARYPALSSP